MIELPEVRTIDRDLEKEILGKEIIDVLGNFTDHKFTFYYKEPDNYKKMLVGKKVTMITKRNYYVEIEIENYKLIFRDGINIRYYDSKQVIPEKSKLLLKFKDCSCLNATVAMYGFISVCGKEEDMHDMYYDKEIKGISPLDSSFTFDYFKSLINEQTEKLSAKAFLATEQRILGIGNGVVQDILFFAKLSPKTKMKGLDDAMIEILYHSIIETLQKMIKLGGRDTEKNIYGEYGGYQTILSNKNYKNGCPSCKSEIKKENYLGGSIYYCPNCQK